LTLTEIKILKIIKIVLGLKYLKPREMSLFLKESFEYILKTGDIILKTI